MTDRPLVGAFGSIWPCLFDELGHLADFVLLESKIWTSLVALWISWAFWLGIFPNYAIWSVGSISPGLFEELSLMTPR